MKKLFCTISAAAVIATTPAFAETLTIGLSWNSKTQPLEFGVGGLHEGRRRTAGSRSWPHHRVGRERGRCGSSRQATNIEDLITQGVDVIVARAEDAGAIGASIRAANAAGIPFITFDRAAANVEPTAHVGGDSFDQAVTTAEAFADLLAANGVTGQCIELQGALTDINAINRSAGWAQVDAARDEISTIAQVPTERNPELFRSGLANALRANPEANCGFIASDFAITAVQAALEEAGRWAPAGEENHFWLATQDLLPGAVPLMEQGYISTSRPLTMPSSIPRNLSASPSPSIAARIRVAARMAASPAAAS